MNKKHQHHQNLQNLSLDTLIDMAYALFDYPICGELLVCKPCCISQATEKQLLTTPVADLSRELICDYMDAVHYDNVGNQIKHFLPRILQLLADGQDTNHIATELNLQRCHFEKPCWQAAELEFIHAFAKRLFADWCDGVRPLSDNLMAYIDMFCVAGLGQIHHQLFAIWQQHAQSFVALKNFVDCYRFDSYGIFAQNPNFNQDVHHWLNHPNTAAAFLPPLEAQILYNDQLSDKDGYWFGYVHGHLEKLLNQGQ